MKKFKNESRFLKVLKIKVSAHLKNKEKGNYKLFIKTAIIILVAIGLYLIPYFFHLTVGLYISNAILRGWVMGLAGFNIGHDAIHGSYSKKEWVNKLLGYSFDACGVSSYFWDRKHNIAHHTYTNISGMDDDIETNDFLRISPVQKWYPVYRFQFIYAFVLYGLLHFQWFIYNDLKKLRNGKVGETPIPPMNRKELFILFSSKVLYITKSLILPIIFLGFWQGLISFLVMEFVCGLTISVVFQLAHIQNKSKFTGTSNEWAYHQVETTADFATWNPLITWQLGGLNFQTIHHLLPKVSHVHYPKIQKIFRQTCREFGLKYNTYGTMVGAIWDHISYLYKMGKKPKVYAL